MLINVTHTYTFDHQSDPENANRRGRLIRIVRGLFANDLMETACFLGTPEDAKIAADVLNDLGELPDGFHWRNGWYFKRSKTGEVVAMEFGGPSIRPVSELRSVLVIPPNEWASIVASVSAGGETGETYRAALGFHEHGTDPR